MQQKVEAMTTNKSINHKRVAMPCSIFSLLFYLLISTTEEIEETYYFLGNAIDKSVRDNFPNATCINYKNGGLVSALNRHLIKIRLKWVKDSKWPFLKSAEIFAQDHLFYQPILIGKRNYTLLADCPDYFGIHTKEGYVTSNKRFAYRTGFKKWLAEWLLGEVFANCYGMNRQCTTAIICEEHLPAIFEGKKVVNVSLKEAWEGCHELKRSVILSKFNLCKADIESLSAFSTAIFTQPFMDDGVLTEKEHWEVYRHILSQYDAQSVTFKVHPRDKFRYAHYFPGVHVFNKSIPMQLLDLNGVCFTTVATISSSSVYHLSGNPKVDWYGSQIHEKILLAQKEVLPPK